MGLLLRLCELIDWELFSFVIRDWFICCGSRRGYFVVSFVSECWFSVSYFG